MTCPVCGAALPADAIFCGVCGSAVGTREERDAELSARAAPTGGAGRPEHPVASGARVPVPRTAPDPAPPGPQSPPRSPDPAPPVADAPVPESRPAAASAPPAPAPPVPSAPPALPAPPVPEELTRLPAAVPRPAAARFVLVFSTGEHVVVEGTGLIGRRPQAQPGESFDTLVAIDDPGRSVSKTHLEFGQDGGSFWVSDRYSANGTVVREPDRPARLSAPGMRSRVARGSRVEIGEQFFVVS